MTTTMRLPLWLALLTACAAAAAPPPPSTWDRVMLTAAAEQGAVCLDGSPGGYFIQRGDPQRWILFMQVCLSVSLSLSLCLCLCLCLCP